MRYSATITATAQSNGWSAAKNAGIGWVSSPQTVTLYVPDLHKTYGGTALSTSFSLPYPAHAYRVDWTATFTMVDNSAGLAINGTGIFGFDPRCNTTTFKCSSYSKSGTADVSGKMKASNSAVVTLYDDGLYGQGYLYGMRITLKFYYR